METPCEEKGFSKARSRKSLFQPPSSSPSSSQSHHMQLSHAAQDSSRPGCSWGGGSAGRQGHACSAAVQLTFLCRYIGADGFKSAASCDQRSTTCCCLKPFMFSGNPGTGWCGLSAMEPSGKGDSPPYCLDKSHAARQLCRRVCFREVLCFQSISGFIELFFFSVWQCPFKTV